MPRCINSPFTDIYFHLAAEEYLLKQCADDVFMLWQDTSSVVLGKHQRVRSEVDREWAEKEGIHIARRFSGGGTVYHDMGNVNLTFIETVACLPDFTTYLHRTLKFLASMGIAAEGDERLGIYLNGLKISGSAQCVHKNRVLYHCTLLYNTDLNRLDQVKSPSIVSDGDERSDRIYTVPSVRSEVTNIQRCLSSGDINHFKESAFRYFSQWQAKSSFTDQELEAIHRLREDKYAQDKWIYSR